MDVTRLTLHQEILLKDFLKNDWHMVMTELIPLVNNNQRRAFEPDGIIHDSGQFLKVIKNAAIYQPIVRLALENAAEKYNREDLKNAANEACLSFTIPEPMHKPATFHMVNKGNSTGVQIAPGRSVKVSGGSSSSIVVPESRGDSSTFSMVIEGHATGMQISGGTIDIRHAPPEVPDDDNNEEEEEEEKEDPLLTIDQMAALPMLIQSDYLRLLIPLIKEGGLLSEDKRQAFLPHGKFHNAEDVINKIAEEEIGQYMVRRALESEGLRGLADGAKLATGLVPVTKDSARKRKLESEEEDVKDECVICYVNKIDTVVLKCRHRSMCAKCGAKQTECPMCRGKITELIVTFDVH